MWQEHEQGSQRRGTGMRLTERTRKLIPETYGEAYLKERSV